MSAPHHAEHAHAGPSEDLSPTEYWEQRYSGREPIWSGKVNETMASVVRDLTPGTALDLGCGEGGDVLWLAEQGWQARGLDISVTAVGRARTAATARGLETATFTATDLSTWEPEPHSLDLVTASFFQSTVALDRTAILRRAAAALRPGGHLVVTSHAAPPSWASDHPARMVSIDEEVQQLAQPAEDWDVVTAEERPRPALDPEGHAGEHLDALLVLRRR
ncbi:16S rRNA methyltransferase [Brachybacterium vulturis]|uniref:16S rRNA methyltransferase n=1 Tax=Brachybacterium vulturis TaxID=2017484 RepID=A0A291GK64_9MICO|nr:class I SAM-dependent methyltransferase [Brachybacterium vulturis]ATG50436.1 16S rRNA methyltransferase [Brachybacterium vulturis]